MTFRTIVTILAMCALCVPQLIVVIPDLGERIKTPDLFAVLTIPIVLLLCALRFPFRKEQVAVVLAIGFAAVVVFVRILSDADRELYLENLPHLARLFTVHAPLLLVAAMPTDLRKLSRWILGFGVLASVTSVGIAVMYHLGSNAFDAHQTFARSGGDLSHRLGGLMGESGAFAFNAMMGIQLLLVGLALANKRKSYYFALLVIFPLFVGLIYHESLVRVALLNSLVFFFVGLVAVNHSGKVPRLMAMLVMVIGIVTLCAFSASGNPLIDVQVERVNFSGNFDRLTSGRLSHWIVAAQSLLESPSYLLFGMGHRASDSILGHPIENMVLFHLVNYGVIGTILFAMLYAKIALPIFRAGLQGDFAGGVFSATLLSVVVQWQVNDVNLYYQTFPCLLFFAAWYTAILQQQESPHSLRAPVTATPLRPWIGTSRPLSGTQC